MTRPLLAALLIPLALLGCNRPDPKDAEIQRLQGELDAARAAPPPPMAPPLPPPPTVQLAVTWPTNPAADYRIPYVDPARCEEARRAVLAENDRREAENQARVGRVNAAGTITLAVGEIPKASAVCIPL